MNNFKDEEFPKKWYLRVTEKNINIANEWRLNQIDVDISYNISFKIGGVLLSKHENDNSYFYINNIKQNNFYDDYIEITTQQWMEHIYIPFNTKNKTMANSINRIVENSTMADTVKAIKSNRYLISWQQGQQLVDAACPDWKMKLFIVWGKEIVLKQDIVVAIDFYKKIREAATKIQHELLDSIFGEDEEELDLLKGTGICKLQIYSKTEQEDSLIQIRTGGNLTNKGFYLHPNFNWSIVEEDEFTSTLVLTKK